MNKPNILIFMTDQQRGSTALAEHQALTPNLDRFAQAGVTFTDARCPSPHCCPSRATFFSGLMPTQHGVWNNVTVPNALSRGLNDDVRLWSQDLVERGYACHFAGKWHVNNRRGPMDYGWREGFVTSNADRENHGYGGMTWPRYQTQAKQDSTDQPAQPGDITRPGWCPYRHFGVNENPFNDAAVVADGVEAVTELAAGAEPWCCYVGTLGPHDPYVVPQRFLDLYDLDDIELPPSFHDAMADKPDLYRKTRAPFDQLSITEHKEAIRHYLAFVSYEDFLFGEILAALEATGAAENTIVIYTSDHGDYVGDHGLWCKGLPCFRGAYDVPLMVRWPAGITQPGRRCGLPVSLADIAPTIRNLINSDYAGPCAGFDLSPILANQSPDQWRIAHFTQSNGNEVYGNQRSVDDGRWKYVWNGFARDELYDLVNDPNEIHNLIDDARHHAERNRLCADMWAFAQAHGDTCTSAYIMVAHAPVGPASAFDQTGQRRPLVRSLSG